MKKKLLVGVLPVFAFILAACGDDNNDSVESPPPDTVITTGEQATKATAATFASIALANGTLGMISLSGNSAPAFPAPRSFDSRSPQLSHLVDMQAKALAGPKAHLAAARKSAAAGARATTTVTETSFCNDIDATGGTVSVTGTANSESGAFNYTLTVTYNNCHSSGAILDGTLTLTGAESITYDANNTPNGGSESFSMTFGNGDAVLDDNDLVATIYKDETYTTVEGKVLFGISEQYNRAYQSATSVTVSQTANGAIESRRGSDRYSISIANLTRSGGATKDTAGLTSGSYVTSGSIGQAWTIGGQSGSSNVRFWNNGITFKYLVDNTTTERVQFELHGTTTLDFTPDDACFEGTFTIVTTQPLIIEENKSTGAVTRIQKLMVVINGNTTVTDNGDGTITVEAAGQTTMYNENNVDLICPLAQIG